MAFPASSVSAMEMSACPSIMLSALRRWWRWGATPIALGVAAIIYVFNALTYAEGSAMLPEGGGSASYARLAFNDIIGFTSGWMLMLSYIVTVAISAYTVPPYLSYFWPALTHPVAGTLVAMGIVFLLMLINVFGTRESSGLNIFFISIGIVTQITLVVLGAMLLLIPNPQLLVEHMFGPGNWPSAQNLVFGIAIAALCFTGVESVAQQGEETRRPERTMPRAYILMIVAVLVLFAGISLVALTAMTPQELGDPVNGWARDPVAGIASAVSKAIVPEQIAAGVASEETRIIIVWILRSVRDLLPALVAILAATILVTATNAGILGISRLTYNLSTHRQLPATLSRVHHRFRTPYVTIILFCSACLALLIPGFFSPSFFVDLGALYVFGSLLVFALAHAAILRLRITKPDLRRPFRLGGNIKIGRHALPVTAIMGLLGTIGVWTVVIIIQPYSRTAGFIWLALGFVVYSIYRWTQHLSLIHVEKDAKEKVAPDKTELK
ncbi:MAG: APC family permease [Chloroflexota bacterium]